MKPLGVIWGKFEQWSEKNTIMFDDIRRNFIMNPQSGLKVTYLDSVWIFHCVFQTDMKRRNQFKSFMQMMDFHCIG